MEEYDGLPIGVNYTYIYIYMALGALIVTFLVFRSKAINKFALLAICFYLFTGNYDNLLTFKIPGIGFFEIQPERFLFLVCSIFFIRRFLSSGFRRTPGQVNPLPLFAIPLFLFIGSVIISQATHVNKLGIAEVIAQGLIFANIGLIIFAIRFMADRAFIEVVGQVVIITAVLTSIISLVQLGVDHRFMQMGDLRQAYGSVLRSNGIFTSEYTNSYFLIMAIYWTLTSMKDNLFKWLLVGLFIAGIFTSFHRMSWLILSLSLAIYFLRLQKMPFDRLIFAGLSGVAVLLFIFIFAYRDIVNSSIVKDRLNDSIKGREGYWTMVVNHIGEKPIFGFGNADNEVYYANMLKITRDRDRATGETGDIHNGYLQALFFLGIPCFVFFVSFVITTILFFGRLLKYHLFFAMPFLAALLYGIGNLTNNFLFNKPVAIICTIYFGLGLAMYYLRDFNPTIEASK